MSFDDLAAARHFRIGQRIKHDDHEATFLVLEIDEDADWDGEMWRDLTQLRCRNLWNDAIVYLDPNFCVDAELG